MKTRIAIVLAVWKSSRGAKPAVISGWRVAHADDLEQMSEGSGKATTK